MNQRLNPTIAAPGAYKTLMDMEAYLQTSGLDEGLTHLVKTRASQINGCAYCLHMHTSDALKLGEDPKRLFLLDAWRESTMYTPRERAALAWTEALTNIKETHAPDEDFAAVKAEFSEKEMVDLTLLIAGINAWNRLAIGFRSHHPNDKAVPQAAAA